MQVHVYFEGPVLVLVLVLVMAEQYGGLVHQSYVWP